MRFVMIASLVLQERADEAKEDLTEFVSVYRSLVRDYKAGWSYLGTRHFIEGHAMDEARKKLLLRLIDILETPERDVTLEQIMTH